MSAAHKNECPVSAGQVVNPITKFTADFTAHLGRFTTGFYLDKSIDLGFVLCCVALVVQAIVMTLPDVLQAIDWAGLVALGGVVNTTPAVFTGTDNPRHLRVIQALMTRPLPREQLDKVAGCSNGPELVAELRRRGLDIECTRTKKKDRDLFDCWPGVYHFTTTARRRVIQWLAKRNAGEGGNA